MDMRGGLVGSKEKPAANQTPRAPGKQVRAGRDPNSMPPTGNLGTLGEASRRN